MLEHPLTRSELSLWAGGQCFFDIYVLAVFVCAGSSVSGYDDTSSDNSTADAADPSAASPEPSAAPGSSPAATGPHVTAGNVQLSSQESFQQTVHHIFSYGGCLFFGVKTLLMYTISQKINSL